MTSWKTPWSSTSVIKTSSPPHAPWPTKRRSTTDRRCRLPRTPPPIFGPHPWAMRGAIFLDRYFIGVARRILVGIHPFISIQNDDFLQDGAPKIAFSCLISVAKNGRYNYSIHGGYFMVYKPTNISGGPSCGIECDWSPRGPWLLAWILPIVNIHLKKPTVCCHFFQDTTIYT